MKPEIRIEKFKSGLPREFEIIYISDLYNNAKNIITDPHRPDFYHIIWITEGNATHYVDFKPVNLQPESILFVPKNCINIFDKTGEYDGKMILFTDRFFCKNSGDFLFLQNTILYNDYFNISKIDAAESISSFSVIFELLEKETLISNDIFQDEILRNLLHSFLLLAEREKRRMGFFGIDSGTYSNYLILFRSLLEENFKKIKSVSEYASKLNISSKTLSNSTVQLLGKTPKELIDERILLESKRLLIHTNATIKEIGFDLGFDEATNFIKYFRKHERITPIDFRKYYKR